MEGLLQDFRVFGFGELILMVYSVPYEYFLWKKMELLEELFSSEEWWKTARCLDFKNG